MAKQLQLRRGTTAQHSTFTGAAGEVTLDTDKDVVVVHDGSTAGGKAMVKEADTAYTIATVNDFGTVPVGYTTVIVKDIDRGGIFVWSASGTANGGTVFAGSSGYWIRQYDGAINVKWFPDNLGMSCGSGNDDTVGIQAAVSSGDTVVLPEGFYKITSPIYMSANSTLLGSGFTKSIIYAYGCTAVEVLGDNVTLQYFGIENYNSSGAFAPKTNPGIHCKGASGTHINKIHISNVQSRGGDVAFKFDYTWDVVLNNSRGNTCTTAVNFYGLSVNNAIDNCQFSADVSCIQMDKDGAINGEGLMISNSLLVEAQYGILTKDWLSLHISNCIIDLITQDAINASSCRGLLIDNSWLYATSKAINFAALCCTVDIKASINNCNLTSTANESRTVYIGNGNNGVLFSSTHITCGTGTTNGRILYADDGSESISLQGCNFYRGGTGESLRFGNGTDYWFDGCTGDVSVKYNNGIPPQRGKVAAAISFNGITGVANMSYNCSVTRNEAGSYTITFNDGLSSNNFAAIITARRDANVSIDILQDLKSEAQIIFRLKNELDMTVDSSIVDVIIYH